MSTQQKPQSDQQKAQQAKKKHSQIDESGADLSKQQQPGNTGKSPSDQRTNKG